MKNLFPNWPGDRNAEFKTLRAAGGFLVSSSIEKGKVQKVEIHSENDNQLKIYNPWKNNEVNVILDESKKLILGGDIIQVKVTDGQNILLMPVN